MIIIINDNDNDNNNDNVLELATGTRLHHSPSPPPKEQINKSKKKKPKRDLLVLELTLVSTVARPTLTIPIVQTAPRIRARARRTPWALAVTQASKVPCAADAPTPVNPGLAHAPPH